MPAPATHDFVHLEISSASVLNTSVNGPLNYLIGRDTGSDDAIELEDSLEILSGNGRRYLRLPQGSSGQRPTGALAARCCGTTRMIAHQKFTMAPDWFSLDLRNEVTYGNLNATGTWGVGQPSGARATRTSRRFSAARRH